MSEQKRFKLYFDEEMARQLGRGIEGVYEGFETAVFVNQITPQLSPLELKARVAVFSKAMRTHLPPDYPDAVKILLAILRDELAEEEGMFNDGWFLMPVAHFVEMYGLDHFDESMAAMYEITKRHTAEFAIRPFITKYPDRVLSILHNWTADPSPHVRRLVSEGTRPRLPWAGRLYEFIEDPNPTLALLEKLQNDPSEYVRRSVANHLNDIAKDHPDLVVETCRRWQVNASKGTQWIIRHALRSLVKQGHDGALEILGYGAPAIALELFAISPVAIQMGEVFTLDFTICSTSDKPQNLVIDYVVHFVKANGSTSGKVFKWKTAVLSPHDTLSAQKTHRIKPITTRRYYPGDHRVELQINGRPFGTAQFQLMIEEQHD
ncbi:MAG: DNA alkylation repair protein [Chloroflexi bacterium]|nr:MAG: DNA alkylation repair protein [Chloroflexota bacterium]